MDARGYLTLIPEVFSNANLVRSVGKKVLKHTSQELGRIKGFLQSVLNHFNAMSESLEEDDSDAKDIKDFVSYLKDCIDKFQEFTAILSNSASTHHQLIVSINHFLISLPALLESIKTLDLGTLSGSLPKDVEELQHTVSKNIALFISEQLPETLHGWIEKIQSDVLKVDESSLNEFAKKTEFERDLILVTLEEINDVLRAFVVLIDKNEIRFTLREGSILEKIKFKMPFDYNDDEKSLDYWCRIFKDAYLERIKITGRQGAEVYPYTKSKLQARKTQLQQRCEYYLKKTNESIEANPIWSIVIEDCLSLIDEKIQMVEASKTMFLGGDWRSHKKEGLQILRELLQETKNLEQARVKFKSKKNIPTNIRDEIWTDNYIELKKMLDLAVKQIKHQRLKIKIEICRLQSKIGEMILLPENFSGQEELLQCVIKTNGNLPVLFKNKGKIYIYGCATHHWVIDNKRTEWCLKVLPVDDSLLSFPSKEPCWVDSSQVSSLVYAEIEKQKAHVYTASSINEEMLKRLTQPKLLPPAPSSPSFQTALLEMAKLVWANLNTFSRNSLNWIPEQAEPYSLTLSLCAAVEKIETEIKRLIDPETFNHYFVDRGEIDLVVQGSWVQELGNDFKLLCRLSGQLNKLRTEFHSASIDRNVSAKESLAYLTQMANEFLQLSTEFAFASMHFFENPFVTENMSLVYGWLNSIPEKMHKMKNHPALQFLQTEITSMFKRMYGAPMFSSIVSEIERYYPVLAQKSSQDALTISITINSLKHIKQFTEDFYREFSIKEFTASNQFVFILRHLAELMQIIPSLGDVNNILKALPKDLSFKLINEINDFFKNIFILIDTVEITFHLQEGFIANQMYCGKNTLHYFVNNFYQILNESHFEFQGEDVFPYTVPIYKERCKLLVVQEANLENSDREVNEAIVLEKKLNRELIIAGQKSATKLPELLQKAQNAVDDIISFCAELNRQMLPMSMATKNVLISEVIVLLNQELTRHDRLINLDSAKEPSSDLKAMIFRKEHLEIILGEIKKIIQTANFYVDALVEEGVDEQFEQLTKYIERYKKVTVKIKQAKANIACGEALKQCNDLIKQPITTIKDARKKRNALANQRSIVYSYSTDYKNAWIHVNALRSKQSNIKDAITILENRTNEMPMPVGVKNASIYRNEVHRSILRQIDRKLIQLQQQRHKSYLFFSQRRRLQLEYCILGLTKLKEFYLQPGYTFELSLQEVYVNHIEFYYAMLSCHKEWLGRLGQEDKAIKNHGNRLVNPSLPQVVSYPMLSQKQMLDQRIMDLQAKQKKWYRLHSIKRKINLLTLLKNLLHEYSLDKAIEQVRLENPKDFYLLFEGETGNILQDLQLGTLSKEDMLYRLDIEVDRLKQEWQQANFLYRFFKHDSNENHLRILNKLKDHDMQLEVLTDTEKNKLKKYDSHLFFDLFRWDHLFRQEVVTCINDLKINFAKEEEADYATKEALNALEALQKHDYNPTRLTVIQNMALNNKYPVLMEKITRWKGCSSSALAARPSQVV